MTKFVVASTGIWPSRVSTYGSEWSLAVLCEGLQQAGHDVTFIAPPGSKKVGRFLPIPCTYGQFPMAEERKAYDWYRDELLSSEMVIDAQGTHLVTENLWFWDREKFKGIQVWMHNGNEWPSPRPPVISQIHGVVYSEAQKKNGLEKRIGQMDWASPKPENVHVIPYGFPKDLYYPAANPTLDYVLFLARPTKSKGIFEFLEIAKRVPDQKFVMAFDMAADDHKTQGAQAIQMARAIPNVTYVPLNGSFETKLRMFQNAKAALAPLDKDYQEGWGLTNGEALLCGTPVITANHGSPPEIFTPDTGILCPAGDLDAYVSALGKVDTLSRKACRELMLKDFSVERWVKDFERLYEELRSKT